MQYNIDSQTFVQELDNIGHAICIDSLKRTDSQEAFVQDSFYTGHASVF